MCLLQGPSTAQNEAMEWVAQAKLWVLLPFLVEETRPLMAVVEEHPAWLCSAAARQGEQSTGTEPPCAAPKPRAYRHVPWSVSAAPPEPGRAAPPACQLLTALGHGGGTTRGQRSPGSHSSSRAPRTGGWLQP